MEWRGRALKAVPEGASDEPRPTNPVSFKSARKSAGKLSEEVAGEE